MLYVLYLIMGGLLGTAGAVVAILVAVGLVRLAGCLLWAAGYVAGVASELFLTGYRAGKSVKGAE